ncbi:MAG: type II toxin-antitoxin system RelE/ParE family toxin, partial [Methylobacter sp.]
ILFSPTCRKYIKKQTAPFQLAIRDEIDAVCDAPEMGESKKGDLAGCRVHKFVFRKQLYLVAYRVEANCILFCMMGTHENFYRDLKR